ncbi:hypothetical protein SMC26_10240 [Actinomadura fulvescens]|uniref:hypothetical protein n=1 Tax=Actinomadura fulvescens TaxID=46160 RepID=UPI0031D3BCA9
MDLRVKAGRSWPPRQHAPAEMRGRPAVRRLVSQTVDRNPRLPGVQELAAIIARA